MVVPLPILPGPVRNAAAPPAKDVASRPADPAPIPPVSGAPDAISDDAACGNIERDPLLAAMEKSGWVQAKAARLLGLTPRQVGYAIRKHGISIQKF